MKNGGLHCQFQVTNQFLYMSKHQFYNLEMKNLSLLTRGPVANPILRPELSIFEKESNRTTLPSVSIERKLLGLFYGMKYCALISIHKIFRNPLVYMLKMEVVVWIVLKNKKIILLCNCVDPFLSF